MRKMVSVFLAVVMMLCSTSAASALDALERTPHAAPNETEIVSVTADGSEAVIKWTRSETPGAFYQIMYSQSSSFEGDNKTVSITGTDAVAITVGGLSYGKWYFRIRACETIDGVDRFSKWSSAKSVSIVPSPVGIYSLDLIEGGIHADWARAYPYSCRYQIRLGTDPELASFEVINITNNYATSLDTDWLEPLTDYYIKIRAYDTVNGDVYYSEWSDIKSITTGEDTPEAARHRNAEKIWALGKLVGMTDEQCAGVLGNLTVESDVDPTAVEGIFTEPYQIGPRKSPLFDGNDITPAMEAYTTVTLFGIYAANGLGINHPAYRFNDGRFCAGLGLIQFTGRLAQGLFKYARDSEKKWYDMDLQMAAVIGGTATTRDRFRQFMNDKENAVSVYGATASWLGIMEMGIEAPSFLGIGFEMRYQHAQQWYEKLSPNSFMIAKRYRDLAESAVHIAYDLDLEETLE